VKANLGRAWAILGAVLLAGCGPFQPTDADKDLCLTIDDLNELGFGAEVERSAERWFGVRGIGTRHLTYRYDQTKPRSGQQVVILQCEAKQERTAIEAMTTYQLGIMTSKAISLGDIEEKRRAEGKCKGADACVLIDFYAQDRVIGNHFVVRSGRHVVSATLFGPHFDDLDEWRDVVAQKVEALDRTE
jgi:hypothetical protein